MALAAPTVCDPSAPRPFGSGTGAAKKSAWEQGPWPRAWRGAESAGRSAKYAKRGVSGKNGHYRGIFEVYKAIFDLYRAISWVYNAIFDLYNSLFVLYRALSDLYNGSGASRDLGKAGPAIGRV